MYRSFLYVKKKPIAVRLASVLKQYKYYIIPSLDSERPTVSVLLAAGTWFSDELRLAADCTASSAAAVKPTLAVPVKPAVNPTSQLTASTRQLHRQANIERQPHANVLRSIRRPPQTSPATAGKPTLQGQADRGDLRPPLWSTPNFSSGRHRSSQRNLFRQASVHHNLWCR
jgi:hypothetical protein